MDIWHIRAPGGPKSGPIFFLAAPKFYPRQKDPKRVLSAGAWGLVPKSAVWGPPNPEIRNLRPPKFGKKNFFRTCNIFFPKVHPKRSLTHPHRPPSDQNCPKARGPPKVPMWTCHVHGSVIGSAPLQMAFCAYQRVNVHYQSPRLVQSFTKS